MNHSIRNYCILQRRNDSHSISRVFVMLYHLCIIGFNQCIAISHNNRFPKLFIDIAYAPRRAQRLIFLYITECIGKILFSEIRAYHFFSVINSEVEFIRPIFMKRLKYSFQDRHISNRNKRLWQYLGVRIQPCTFSACHDNYGNSFQSMIFLSFRSDIFRTYYNINNPIVRIYNRYRINFPFLHKISGLFMIILK